MTYRVLLDVLDPGVQFIFKELVPAVAGSCGADDADYLRRWLGAEYMGTAGLTKDGVYASRLLLGLNLRGFEAAINAWGAVPAECLVYRPPPDDPLHLVLAFPSVRDAQ